MQSLGLEIPVVTMSLFDLDRERCQSRGFRAGWHKRGAQVGLGETSRA